MAEKQNNDAATTVADEIAGAEVVQFGKRDFNTYNRLISNIDRGFSKASEAYIAIGCSLWQIHHNEYYRIDNYKSIADFALEKFEIKKATTHNYIKVIEKFGQIVSWCLTPESPVLYKITYLFSFSICKQAPVKRKTKVL